MRAGAGSHFRLDGLLFLSTFDAFGAHYADDIAGGECGTGRIAAIDEFEGVDLIALGVLVCV